MKQRFWIDSEGKERKVVRLSAEEKHRLREKNLKVLREQRLMKETVQYADYKVPTDSSDEPTTSKGA